MKRGTSIYKAPIQETLFLLNEVFSIREYGYLNGFNELPVELLSSILAEAGRFAEDVLAPLNTTGDVEGCIWHSDGSVSTPTGFKAAYRAFVDAGWNAINAPEADGGQGLPVVIATAVDEYINAANQSFAMYTNWGAAANMLIGNEGAAHLRRDYLAKIVSGEWSGTMALTEAHCGTDIGLLRTRATREPDGSFKINGTKIFNSGGEHDLTTNIVHFVLARIEGAPSGTKGISLFLVPKFLVTKDGEAYVRNAVSCGSIEHKMGLRGSATCVMNFDGARGFLLGEESRGLNRMFLLMNDTRRRIGAISVGVSDVAYQRASAYVKERLQGRPPSGAKDSEKVADPLISQPDVRRVLMTIQAYTQAGRALTLWTGLQCDISERSPNAQERHAAADRLGIMTPVVKAVLSDMAFANTVMAQQLFGGHGYIVETGMDQYVRDVRVLMVAEGANGVQAMDLVLRKLIANEGRAMKSFIEELTEMLDRAPPGLANFTVALYRALEDLKSGTARLSEMIAQDVDRAAAVAYDYMKMFGLVLLGQMWLRIVVVTAGQEGGGASESHGRLELANFFAERELPATALLLKRLESGETIMALEEGRF